jgi:hypothetical protein
VAVRTLWHEVIEARQAEAKADPEFSRETWPAADPVWLDQFDELAEDVRRSMTPDGTDPRAVRIDLMAHLSAHIDAMDGKP